MKTIIVAYDKHRGIGFENDMPWKRSQRGDLQRFKQLTVGNAVIMGRKTFESLPFVLPDRLNIVVTHQPIEIEGAKVVDSLQKAYELASEYPQTCIIGGAQIYEQSLADTDRIYATEIDAEFTAQKFFPELDMSVWQEVEREHHEADDKNKYPYDFVTYTKKA